MPLKNNRQKLVRLAELALMEWMATKLQRAKACTFNNVSWESLQPNFTLVIGNQGNTPICMWCQSTNYWTNDLYDCPFKSKILDYNFDDIQSSSVYTRSGESCVYIIRSVSTWDYWDNRYYRGSQYIYWGLDGSSGCGTRGIWAQNDNAYEDFRFYIAYWDMQAPSNIFYQGVDVRLQSPCYPNTITMSPAIPIQTVYSGAYLQLNNQYAGSVFNVGLSTTCQKLAWVEVSFSNVWYGSGTSNYNKLIDWFSHTMTATGVSIRLNPSQTTFNPGLSSTMQTIPVQVYYQRQYEYFKTSSTFNVNILPQSSIVALCQSQTNSIISKTNLVTDKLYIVGSSALTIDPPTFTPSAPTDNLYNNYNLPIQSIYRLLEYSLDNVNWQDFPSVASQATFFSMNNDSTCVSSILTPSWRFTIYCTDNTKFATNEQDVTFYFRYSAQWTQVEDQPTARVYTTNNVNTFKLTLQNGCKYNQVSFINAPGPSPFALNALYSGATMIINPGVGFQHSIGTGSCNIYHRRLVEVSDDGGLTWSSLYQPFSDLVQTPNFPDKLWLKSTTHDARIILIPKIDAFDAGQADVLRKIRVGVKAVFAVQPTQYYVYTVMVKPLSAIVLLADSQLSETLKLARPHESYVYALGDDELSVPTISFVQNPPTAVDNSYIRAPATTTRLYYSPDMGATWTEVTTASSATWTSSTGDESCFSWMDNVSKAFKLRCQEPINYQFPGGIKTWHLKFTVSYTPVEGLPVSPNVISTKFTLTIKNVIIKLTFLQIQIPIPPVDYVVPISSPQFNSVFDKTYTYFENYGEQKIKYDETKGNLVVEADIQDGKYKAILTLPRQEKYNQAVTYNITLYVHHEKTEPPMPKSIQTENEETAISPKSLEKDEKDKATETDQVGEMNSKLSKSVASKSAPTITLDSMTPYGLLKFHFSKSMRIPSNITMIDDSVLDVQLRKIQENDQKTFRKLQQTDNSPSRYTWKVTAFQKWSMEVQLHFAQAYLVNSDDEVTVTILNKAFFVAQETEETLEDGNLQLEAACKPQIQEGSDENFSKLISALTNQLTKTLLVIAALPALLGALDMELIWHYIRMLQVLSVFPFVQVEMPGNLHSLLQQLFQVTTYNVIDADSFNYSLSKRLGLGLWRVNAKITAMNLSSSQIGNFGFVFVFGAIILYIYLVGLICQLSTHKLKVNQALADQVHKLNTSIKRLLNIPFFVRLFLETYFLQAIVHVIRLKASKWTPATEGFATFIAATNVIGLSVVPALTCWRLWNLDCVTRVQSACEIQCQHCQHPKRFFTNEDRTDLKQTELDNNQDSTTFKPQPRVSVSHFDSSISNQVQGQVTIEPVVRKQKSKCGYLFKQKHCQGESLFTKLFYPVYKEVRIHQVLALPYTVIFMVKRLFLVVCVIVIDGNGLVQSFMTINLLLICCCYDWAVKPLRNPILNFYEGVYDAFGLLIAYSLLCYTDFLPSRKAQYNLGWFIYCLLAFAVLLGACYSTGVTFNAIKRNRRIYYRILKRKLQSLRKRIKQFFTKMDPIPLQSDGNLFVKRETVSVIDIGNEKLESINDIESLQKSLEVKVLDVIDEEDEDEEQKEAKVLDLEKCNEVEVVLKRPITRISLDSDMDPHFNRRPTAPPSKPSSPVASITIQIEALDLEGTFEKNELSAADRWFAKHGHKPTQEQVSQAAKIKSVVLQTEVLHRIARVEVSKKKPAFKVKKGPAFHGAPLKDIYK